MLAHTVTGHSRGEPPALVSVVVIKITNIKQRRAMGVCFREGYNLLRGVKLSPSTGQSRKSGYIDFYCLALTLPHAVQDPIQAEASHIQ